MKLTRRGFIKASLAIAAAAALPDLPAPTKDSSLLKKMLESGLVENMTFYIDEPVVIDRDYLTIRNCRFIAAKELDCFLYIEMDCSHTIIHHCSFEGKPAKTGVFFNGPKNHVTD